MGRLGHSHRDLAFVVEGEQHGLGARDGAEHLHHEVGERVAVAIERGDDQGLAGGHEQQGVGGVDQLGLIADVRVTLGGGVELLFEHAFIDGADGVLGTPEDLGLDALGVGEGILGHDPAGATADLLRSIGPLVQAVTLAPLLGAVGVVDRHPDDGDRRVHPGERAHSRDPAARADDHLPVDLLAQDRVRAPDVAGSLGGYGRRLQAVPVFAKRAGGIQDDLVPGFAAPLEGEVEVEPFDLEADDVRVEQPDGLPQQLLPRLVAVKHDDG